MFCLTYLKNIIKLLFAIIFFTFSVFAINIGLNVKQNSNISKKEQEFIKGYQDWKKICNEPKRAYRTLKFFYSHPDWPMFSRLTKIAEKNLEKEEIDEAFILKWFTTYVPRTANSLIIYSKVLLKRDKQKGVKYVNDTWIFQNMSPVFAKKYRKIFAKYISPKSDARRAKRFLRKKDYIQLKMMVDIVPIYIAKYIKSVLKNPKIDYTSIDIDDSNLRYNITRSLNKKNKYHRAALILAANNKNEESAPIKFFMLRREVACNIARFGNPSLAYKIISMHVLNNLHPKQKKQYVKAEWFAGFIAFRFLKDRKNGIKHFQNAYKVSKDAMHKSKTAFWIAEVYLEMNDIISAFNWYKKAYEHYNTFYGYLAKSRLIDISVARFVSVNKQREVSYSNVKDDFENRELVQVLKTIFKYDVETEIKYLLPFYEELANDIDNPEEEKLLFEMVTTNEELEFITRLEENKQKYQRNQKNFKKLTPEEIAYIHKINSHGCFTSLVHSIIKKESMFKKDAKSPVGATGLMQIMPTTAVYEQKRLTFYTGDKNVSLFNPKKNITIGSSILDRLLKKYDNNLILVIAAYNAGEGNIAKFLKSIKNLKNIAAIDMIELIPYKETRLYVKSVLYNMFVYQDEFAVTNCYNCSFIKSLKL